MKQAFNITLLALLIALFALPIMAQESTEAPSPTAETIVTPSPVETVETVVIVEDVPVSVNQKEVETLADNLFSLIANSTYLPFASGLVLLLVAVTKRVPFLADVKAPVISLFYSVLIWVAFLIARDAGYVTEFQTGVESITKLGEVALGFIFVPAGSTALYNLANKQNVAVLGHSRSS